MAYSTFTLTGTYHLFDGEACRGGVEIIPSVKTVKDTTGNVILAGRVKVKLEESLGSFSVVLPNPNDSSLSPSAFGYTVVVKLDNSNTRIPVISFGANQITGPTLDMENVTPVDVSTLIPTVQYPTSTDLANAIAGAVQTAEAYTDAHTPTIADGTTATKGVVRLATSGQAVTGSATDLVVTPAGVKAALDAMVNGAPAALDTLKELADAINDDASFAATVTTALGTKVNTSTYTAGLAGKQSLQQVAATVTADGAAVVNKHNPVDATAAARTITLPTGQSEGTQVSVEKVDTGLNTVTVSGNIRGVGGATIPLAYLSESLMLRADSAGSWWPIAGHRTKASLDATYIKSSARIAPVSIGGYVTTAGSQQSTTGTSRVPYYVTSACTDLQLVYTNWILSSINDADPTSNLVISASIEYAGTIYRVTSNGATTVTVTPGGTAVFDPLALDLPAGALVYVRTYTSGANWYGNRTANATGYGGFTSTTDLTAPGSGAIADASSFTNLLGPANILGRPLTTGAQPPSVLGVGDSIMWGYGDSIGTGVGGVNTSSTLLGFGGFIARAMNGKGGLVNIGVANDTAQNFLTQAGHFRRLQFANRCSSAVVDYGRNDLTGGRTVTQFQADIVAIWTMLAQRGLKVFQTTITPRTTSTDGWRTTGGQTVGSGEANRVTFNDWLRAGAPMTAGAAVAVGTAGALLAGQAGHPLTAAFDTADTVESARNSGLWKTPLNLRSTSDGAWASGSAITSATAAFTSADVGRAVTLAGGGAAGGLYVGKIRSVTNSATVQVVTAPTTVVSGAALTVGEYQTADGIHPDPVAHAAMATAIDTTRLV